jgi:hypothetical protein
VKYLIKIKINDEIKVQTQDFGSNTMVNANEEKWERFYFASYWPLPY